MYKEEYTHKLNIDFTWQNYSDNKSFFSACQSVYTGDLKTSLGEVISLECPFGKVLFVDLESDYIERGAKVTSAIIEAKAKPQTLLLSEPTQLSVESMLGWFDTAEDVRLVVTNSQELFDCVCYFATTKNIPCVLISDKPIVNGLLKRKVSVFNGGNKEQFLISARRYLIFNDCLKNSKQLIVEGLGYCATKLLCLADYRIRLSLTGEKADKKAYGIIKSRLLDLFKILYQKCPDANQILTKLIEIETAEYYSGQSIFYHSAPSVTRRIYKPINEQRSMVELLASCVICEIYCNLASEKTPSPFIPADYIKRAEFLSDNLGIDEKDILSGYKKQINVVSGKKVKTRETLKKLQVELSSTASVIDRALKTIKEYTDLCGIDKELLTKAVLYSGDLMDSLNGMTVARERGIVIE